MKSKILITLILGFTVLFYLFAGSSSNVTKTSLTGRAEMLPPPPAGSNDFLIGVVDNAYDLDFHNIEDVFGFNIWHKYCGSEQSDKHYPTGWTYWAPNDKLFRDDYITQVTDLLSTINSHNMKALMHRPKIEYLCYGQRSNYQCEAGNLPDDYWFYSFNSDDPNHVHTGGDYYDNTSYGNGLWVKRCLTTPTFPDPPGYVVDRLRANTEQCHRNTGDDAWRGDSECDWLIKPRIRIDSNVAHNSQNPLVCNIKVYAQDGTTILKNVDIHANNFLVDGDPPQYYNGRYIEEYSFLGGTDLIIHQQDWLGPNETVAKWWYNARGSKTYTNEWADEHCNHADIQVYWYGNCDMWIDYVRVDNDIADMLLNPNNQFYSRSENWLKMEAQDIGCSSDAAYNFYNELFEFNQIPCIAYVNRKLDSLCYLQCNKHINIMADQLTFYQCHMAWEDRGTITTAKKIKEDYVDKTNSMQVFTGTYPFTSVEDIKQTYSRIPYTLQIFSPLLVLSPTTY